jgi:hypothetical protein
VNKPVSGRVRVSGCRVSKETPTKPDALHQYQPDETRRIPTANPTQTRRERAWCAVGRWGSKGPTGHRATVGVQTHTVARFKIAGFTLSITKCHTIGEDYDKQQD